MVTIASLAWLGTRGSEPDTAVATPAIEVDPVEAKAVPVAGKPSIAVLPFTNFGGDPEQDYFADGVTEEIITSLTRFPDLTVIPRNTSFRYKGQTVDVKEVGQELSTKYVLEGSIRKAENMVRVTVQLLNTMDGNHLWAETYERNLSVADIFGIQDEITERVVGMIAGSYGIISLTDYEQVKRKGTDDLEAYDCVLRLYVYRRTLGEKGHGEMRDCLERTVEKDPEYSDAWAWLAFIYSQEVASGYNPLPAPLDRSIKAARRAVEIDPMSGIAHVALARAYFYLGDLDLFFPEAEKSVTLNPNNSDVLATMGYYLGYAGEHEHGLALMHKAMSLSASYPGWLHESIFWIYFWPRGIRGGTERSPLLK
jgi:adenylate cyclase